MRRRRLLTALAAGGATTGCLQFSEDATATSRPGDATTTAATTATATTRPSDPTTTTSAPTFPPYVSEEGIQLDIADYHVTILGRLWVTLDFTNANLDQGTVDAWQTPRRHPNNKGTSGVPFG